MRQLILFLLVLVGGLVYADDSARFALVIGNGSYDGDAKLSNPANDASDMAAALTSIGWRVTKVIDGDRKTMNRAIADFRDALETSTEPTALLFYAGHGVQISGQNYLIPVGENFETSDEIVTDAVSLQYIQDSFDEAKVSTDIVILDACRDNPFTKKNNRSLGGNRGLTAVTKSGNVEGSVVMFSTAPGETASDGNGRNGVFTQALLKYITTDMKLQDVATRVTGEVKRLTGGKQVPFNSISLSDDFYMVPASMRSSAPPATVDAVPTITPQPAPEPKANPDEVRASLIMQKQALVREKSSIVSKSSWVGWFGGAGWVLAGAGVGLSGYSYYQGAQGASAYNSAVTANDYSSARNQVNSANQLFKVGLGVGVVGLAMGVTSLLLAPDTSHVDKKIQDVDNQITLLGAN